LKAIILAAGKGERLYPLTRNTPKSLLEIGSGITLLENQLMSLTKGGVDEVTLVVGYKAEQIEAKIKDFKEISCTLKAIYNPFYDISNNMISLWFAASEMDEDFLIVNGDDVFGPAVIKGLIDVAQDREICMIIDKKKVYDQEDMKVIIVKDKIKRIGKDIDPKEANGESVGIMRLLGKSRQFFKKVLCEMVRDEKNRNVFYLSVFQQIIDMGWPVYYFEIKPDEWAEVDFHPDLDLVRSHVNAFTKSWNIPVSTKYMREGN
jgi:choline kinase